MRRGLLGWSAVFWTHMRTTSYFVEAVSHDNLRLTQHPGQGVVMAHHGLDRLVAA